MIGIVERKTGKSRIIAKATLNVNEKTLIGMVKEYVLPESTIFTDDFSAYDKLKHHGYLHHRINHSAKVSGCGRSSRSLPTDTFLSVAQRGILTVHGCA